MDCIHTKNLTNGEISLFSYTQYIKFNSNRPVKQAYNIIISQTIPILYLSSDVMLAKQEITRLISTLAGNGFQKSKLIELVIITLSKINHPAIKFEVKDLATALQGMITSNLYLDMRRNHTIDMRGIATG